MCYSVRIIIVTDETSYSYMMYQSRVTNMWLQAETWLAALFKARLTVSLFK